jgi:hypothetical protein
MDYTQIANDVIGYLQALGPTGADLGAGVAANALWDWIKSRFKARSPAAAEAVTAVEKTPASGTDWDVLKLQLRKALEEDETLRRELLALLPKEYLPVIQTAIVSGNENVTIQNAGAGSIISGQR